MKPPGGLTSIQTRSLKASPASLEFPGGRLPGALQVTQGPHGPGAEIVGPPPLPHHYQKIVVALAETIRLMAAIDAAIEAYGGWPL